MDLELKHLGQTIAIGGLTIYSVIFLAKMFFPKHSFFTYNSQDKLQLLVTAVYLALVFAVGIVIEDFSKNFSSGRDSFLTQSFNQILSSDKELRVRTLFQVSEFSQSKIILQQSQLSTEYLIIKATGRIAPYNESLKNSVGETGITIEGTENVENFLSNVNGIYYSSKNSVYVTENYFKELSEIQNRIDFTRSLTLLCLVLFTAYSAIAAVFLLPPIQRILKKFIGFNTANSYKILGLGILFFVGTYLSLTAYRSESTNYNLRVYGYYISQNTVQK